MSGGYVPFQSLFEGRNTGERGSLYPDRGTDDRTFLPESSRRVGKRLGEPHRIYHFVIRTSPVVTSPIPRSKTSVWRT